MSVNVDLVAGLTGGVTSAAVLHPLDLIKVRFQVLRQPHHTTWTAFKQVVAVEGASGLYKGVTAAMLGSGLSWGLYFFFYEHAKRRHLNWSESADTTGRLPPLRHMAAAMEAGATTSLLTNPVWLIKTRMQLQIESRASNYTSVADAFRKIVAEEGFRGLYKGIGPALLLTTHGAVQFGLYEELKLLCTRYNIERTDGLVFGMGAVSKIVASTVTYPYQVVKSRVQQRFETGKPRYTGAIHCAKTTLREEGWRAFFNGLRPNLYRVVPASALTLTVYERVRRLVVYLQGDAESPIR